MSNNVSKIEAIMADLDVVDNAQGAMGASLTWSRGMAMLNAIARRHRMDDTQDPVYGRLNTEDLEQRKFETEKRISELADQLGWVAEYADPRFLPTGLQLVELMEKDDDSTVEFDEDLIEELITTMGMTRERALQAITRNEQRLAENRALQQRAVEVGGHLMAAQIDQAIATGSNAGFGETYDISDFDGARILDRIAGKCEQYITTREARAAGSRRKKIMRELGAECRLLETIMNKADEMSAELALLAENETPASPVEVAVASL